MEGEGVLARWVFSTAMGWMGVVFSDNGLRYIVTPKVAQDEVLEELATEFPRILPPAHSEPEAARQLRSYLEGRRVPFSAALDLECATPFQRRVWEATQMIPWGEVRTYSWVAEKVGAPKAPRAVGRALGANPLPIIIPCHRVVARNGGLGGYSSGLEMKKRFLELEGLRR